MKTPPKGHHRIIKPRLIKEAVIYTIRTDIKDLLEEQAWQSRNSPARIIKQRK